MGAALDSGAVTLGRTMLLTDWASLMRTGLWRNDTRRAMSAGMRDSTARREPAMSNVEFRVVRNGASNKAGRNAGRNPGPGQAAKRVDKVSGEWHPRRAG